MTASKTAIEVRSNDWWSLKSDVDVIAMTEISSIDNKINKKLSLSRKRARRNPLIDLEAIETFSEAFLFELSYSFSIINVSDSTQFFFIYNLILVTHYIPVDTFPRS